MSSAKTRFAFPAMTAEYASSLTSRAAPLETIDDDVAFCLVEPQHLLPTSGRATARL